MSTVLVTGGAGFVGSHLVEALIERRHKVRVLDAMISQVHDKADRQLPEGVAVVRGDVRDRTVVDQALEGVEVVFHQAAEVGVGQSMYEMQRYVSANTLGTAALLEALVERRGQIGKLVVASSMSIYGEGAYRCPKCGPVAPPRRESAQLRQREWELRCPTCPAALQPAPTTETKTLDPSSVYAITKQDQEQLCLVVGRAYGIPTVALRYFNIYGPRQALSNPYTGVCAIFSSRLLNDQRPPVYEDGEQTRDFVHISDIIQANLLALDTDRADYQAFNIGSGIPTSVREISLLLTQGLGKEIEPEIVGKYREGDIRHCVADISRARAVLGYEPKVRIEQGIRQLLDWVRHQEASDRVARAIAELEARQLVR